MSLGGPVKAGQGSRVSRFRAVYGSRFSDLWLKASALMAQGWGFIVQGFRVYVSRFWGFMAQGFGASGFITSVVRSGIFFECSPRPLKPTARLGYLVLYIGDTRHKVRYP